MGEASRRRRARTKAGDDMVAATYARARTVMAYHADLASEASPGEFMGRLADEMRQPTSFRSSRSGITPARVAELVGSPPLDDGEWHLFDLITGYAGASGSLPPGLVRDAGDPFRHYALEETFVCLASASGRFEAKGAGPCDPLDTLSGSVRIDREGAALGPADDALPLQALALAGTGRAGWEHEVHLASLAGRLAASERPDHRAEAEGYAAVACGPATVRGRAGLLGDAVSRLDLARGLGGVAALGSSLGIDLSDWTGRSTPGSGHVWERLDDLVESATGRRPPLRARAFHASLDEAAGMGVVGMARGWIASCALDGRVDGPDFLVEAATSDGVTLAVAWEGKAVAIVAWDAASPEPGPGRAHDPLATEEVAGLDLPSVLLPAQPCPTLEAAAIPAFFRGLEGLADYPARALVMAHAEGCTLGDVADWIASSARDAAPVAAVAGVEALFGAPSPVAERMRVIAASAAGQVDGDATPWLARAMSMLAADLASGGGDAVDLSREIRILRDADMAGATLLDLARRVLAGSMSGHPVEAAAEVAMLAAGKADSGNGATP